MKMDLKSNKRSALALSIDKLLPELQNGSNPSYALYIDDGSNAYKYIHVHSNGKVNVRFALEKSLFDGNIEIFKAHTSQFNPDVIMFDSPIKVDIEYSAITDLFNLRNKEKNK